MSKSFKLIPVSNQLRKVISTPHTNLQLLCWMSSKVRSYAIMPSRHNIMMASQLKMVVKLISVCFCFFVEDDHLEVVNHQIMALLNLGVTNLRWSPIAKNKKSQTSST